MTTLARRNSSIHKIREYALPKVNLEDEYEVLHVMQEGWRGRLLLVEHRRTRNEVVLKAVHKQCTSRVEFFREFHYNYYLSPHTNILNAYDVAFQAGDYFIFAQEYAPFGDLTSNLSETGLGEANVKKIAPQLVSALEFMHSKDLVHRNINMDNILVFNIDFSEVKLCDFGSTRKNGSLLKKKTVWLPYAPPEIVDTVQNEGFHVSTKQDVWQLGVLLYVLLTGALPWQKADVTDPHYVEYLSWKKRKTLKTPKRFSNFTARALRMFKRLLEPKPEKRSSVSEVSKYLEDKWLVRPMKRQENDIDNQSVCYSTFSIHSSKIEKDRVLHTLKAHGIETTVDRIAKRKRIHEWIERSLSNNLMFEEDEGMWKNNQNEQDLLANNVNEINLKSEIHPQLKSTVNHDVIPYQFQMNLNKSNINNKPNVSNGNQDNRPTQVTEQSYDRSMLIGGSNKNSTEKSLHGNDETRVTNNIEAKENNPHRQSPARLATTNVKRRSSFQEYTKKESTQDITRSNNYKQVLSLRINSSKSHYHQSPTRDPFSPLRVHSRSQKVLTKEIHNQTSSSKTDNKEEYLPVNRNDDRSRHFQRTTKPGRLGASRIKSEAYQRSRSLARNPIPSEFDATLSSSSTIVGSKNNESLSRHGSENSVCHSNESLTSVIPLAFC